MTPLWRSLGPAVPPTPAREVLRASLGAGLGLVAVDLILWALAGQGALLAQPLLIAPFGASAFLIFAVPNSPLAQPWSAVVGNTVSALAALAVLRAGLPLVPGIGLAVLLAVLAMALLRALHPPGGAVAIATMLADPGPMFALMPVALGTTALVVAGLMWNRATGRLYPFRLPSAAPPAAQRQTPGPLALAAALSNLRMGANLGVEDLSRLIAAAEAAQSAGPLTAGQVMTRDLITLGPADDLPHAAALFRQYGFRHLPLLDAHGAFVGLVPQTALLGPLPDADLAVLADRTARSLPPNAPLADLLTLLAQGRQLCIPVLQGTTLQGLITHSDLLAAVIHGSRNQKDTQS